MSLFKLRILPPTLNCRVERVWRRVSLRLINLSVPSRGDEPDCGRSGSPVLRKVWDSLFGWGSVHWGGPHCLLSTEHLIFPSQRQSSPQDISFYISYLVKCREISCQDRESNMQNKMLSLEHISFPSTKRARVMLVWIYLCIITLIWLYIIISWCW